MPDLGCGPRRAGFGKGEDARPGGRGFQPPAVLEQPPGQSRSELDADDFPHGVTMPAALAAGLLGLFRNCGFLVQISRRAVGLSPALSGRAARTVGALRASPR